MLTDEILVTSIISAVCAHCMSSMVVDLQNFKN